MAARATRPVGTVTRGTTHQQRLRRVDRWLLANGECLRAADRPLVVDLGFGAVPRTTVELLHRLRARHPGVEVLGLEIDPERVAAAAGSAEPGLSFAVGGFELPVPRRPVVVRAMNVLRQYDEADVQDAWLRLADGVAVGGLVVEGTCDELGRVCSWVRLRGQGGGQPESLTFSAALSTLGSPAVLAERLPKALIHRNRPGEPVHELLAVWAEEWTRAASLVPFGPRARFVASVRALRSRGWPVLNAPARWRLGEVELAWAAVASRLPVPPPIPS